MLESLYDVPTGYLIGSLAFFVMQMITWVALRPARARSVLWWCGGGVFISAGLLVLALRAQYPQLLPFNTGYALALLGNSMHLYALQLETRTPARFPLLVYSLGTVAFKQWLFASLPGSAANYSFGYAMLFAGLAAVAVQAQAIARAESSPSARWLRNIYLVGAVLFIVRTVVSAAGLSDPDALARGAQGVATTAFTIFLGLISNVALISLYLERSNRKAAEAAAAEARSSAKAEMISRLAELDRHRSMSELAAGLAHELGQPLTAILLDVGTLEHDLRRGAPAKQLVPVVLSIGEQAGRARAIVRGIHNFIRPGHANLTQVALPELVRGVQAILEPQLRAAGAQLQLRAVEPAPVVRGDAVQLSQVLLNLLRNSLQARRDAVPLRIDIELRDAGDAVLLAVQDNGVGMSDAQLAMYGSAFFTTKPDGMGIGTAISRRIVEQHGGTIVVERVEPGGGLRTTLRLPRSEP